MVPPVADWYCWNASVGTNIRRQRVVSQSQHALTRSNKNESSTGVDNSSSRRQDSGAAVRDRLVNTPKVRCREGRRERNVFHRAGDDRVVIATKGKLSGATRLRNWNVVDPEYLLRYHSLRAKVVQYCRDCVRVIDRTRSQVDRAYTKDTIDPVETDGEAGNPYGLVFDYQIGGKRNSIGPLLSREVSRTIKHRLIALKFDINSVREWETYNGVPSVFTGASLGICLGSSDPSVGASRINEKRVYNRLARVPGSATDPPTICCRIAYSNLGGVDNHGVRDGNRRDAFSRMTSVFESLGTSAVLLDNVERAAFIDPRSKAESSLAGATTEGTRVHGS
jgi:hypothetical protein